MIARGCSRLSNCAASTMYMKIDASRKVKIRFLFVSSRTFTVPRELGDVTGRQFGFSHDLAHFVGSDIERHLRKRVAAE